MPPVHPPVSAEPVRPEPQQAPPARPEPQPAPQTLRPEPEPFQGETHQVPSYDDSQSEPVQAYQEPRTSQVEEGRATEPVAESETGTGHIHSVSDASERRGEVPTPRRRVIFDDPDDLDVPEFLK